MHALTFEQALKGYPEYRDDQPRGDDGRWAGGGGAHAARVKLTDKQRATRDYERRFGHLPPKSMSADAMRRWIAGPFRTAPGHGKDKATRAIWAEEQRQRASEERSREAQRARRALDDLQRAAEAPKPDAREVGRKSLEAYESLKKVPDDVWYKPTFADHVWSFMRSFAFSVDLPMLNAGLGAVMGAGLLVLGPYLVLRYAYRKLRTAGAYRGVRWAD
jgi:hypothetical protein